MEVTGVPSRMRPWVRKPRFVVDKQSRYQYSKEEGVWEAGRTRNGLLLKVVAAPVEVAAGACAPPKESSIET